MISIPTRYYSSELVSFGIFSPRIFCGPVKNVIWASEGHHYRRQPTLEREWGHLSILDGSLALDLFLVFGLLLHGVPQAIDFKTFYNPNDNPFEK